MKVKTLDGFNGWIFRDLTMALNDGKDVWVKFDNPKETRRGSIGRVVRKKLTESQYAKILAVRTLHSRYYPGVEDRNYYDRGLTIEFPGLPGSNIHLGRNYKWETIDWLDGYDGPAIRAKTELEKEVIPTHLDQYGETAKLGDFIGFIHRERLAFGTITRFSPGGNIYFKTIDGAESYFVGSRNFAIIDKGFRTRMMLKKLAGD